ncbi:hypothetical protein HMPREF9554_01902 [Treponema phagedenis F0421]|nr:hypothetical protein HMPREF9554_01902 [Treponema phagedenis F0421]
MPTFALRAAYCVLYNSMDSGTISCCCTGLRFFNTLCNIRIMLCN